MPHLNKSKLAVAALAALLLAACGGGGDSVAVVNSPSSFMVESGLAQKGPLMQGSQITINELAFSTFQPSGRSFDFEVTNNLGTFDPSGIKFSSPYLSTTAEGYYFNEITGLPSADMVFLRGLSDLYTGEDTTINVNVLSNFSKNRILNLVTGKNLLNPVTGAAVTPAPIKFLKARAQAQSENLKAFYIYNDASILSGTTVGGVTQPANFTALDLSKKRAGDQILAAMSAVVMTAGTDGNGVNTLLSQIEADFADDGLLNNSPKYAQSVQSRLCAAAASTDFAKVATNLNNFYGTNYQATDLSQWMDTSGCADQVINKYKFTANNIAVGTVSKSPAYITGADDIGQCFSVGSLSGASGGLYVGTATAPNTIYRVTDKGISLYVGLTASAAGTASGFLQRFTPTSAACPATFPTGVTPIKVQKYSTIAKIVSPLEINSLQNLLPSTSFTPLSNGNWAMAHRRNGSSLMTLSVLDGTPGNFGKIIWSIDSNQAHSMDYIYFHHNLSVDANQKILWPNGCEISSVSTSGLVAWKYSDETCSSSTSPLYFAALPLADGGVLAVNQANITKVNSQGVVVYKKQISNSTTINAPVWMADAVMAKDGNVLVIAGTQGMSECVSAGDPNCYVLMKIRVSDGSILWRKPVLLSGLNSGFTIRSVKLSDDNIYIAGKGTSLISKKDSNWLLKMNEEGVISAEYDLAASSKFVTVPADISILTTDGSNLYAIAGGVYYSVPRALKITPSGQITWFSDLPNTEWYGIANAIAGDGYGGILVGGINQPAPNTFGWLRYFFP